MNEPNDGAAVLLREADNELEDLPEPAGFWILSRAVAARCLEAEELVGGDAEGESEAGDHLGVGTESSALVVGEDGLDDAHFFGELDLGEAFVLADASEALTEALVAEGQGGKLAGLLGHDAHDCKRRFSKTLDHAVDTYVSIT